MVKFEVRQCEARPADATPLRCAQFLPNSSRRARPERRGCAADTHLHQDCDRLMVAQSAMYGAYALATGLDPSRANKTFYNDSVMSNSHKGATQWVSAHLAGLSAVHGAMSTVSLSKDDRRKLAWVGTGAHAAQAGICAYQRENLGLDKTQAALGFGINLVLAGANLRKALED